MSHSENLRSSAVVFFLFVTAACAQAPAAQPKLSVKAECAGGGNGHLMVHTVLDVDYEFSGEYAKSLGKSVHRRELWNFTCVPGEEECRAVKLDLGNADKGNPLSVFERTPVAGTRSSNFP